jgi:hypothetical protein
MILQVNVFGPKQMHNPFQLNINYGNGSWVQAVSHFQNTATGGHTVSSLAGSPVVTGSTISALYHDAVLTKLPPVHPLGWHAVQEIIQGPPEGSITDGAFAAAGCPWPAAGYTSVAVLPNWSETDQVRFP